MTVLAGSGIGGLSTAALLAKHAGKRALVLERHYMPGGFTHLLRRRGYEWDVGLHYIGQVAAQSATSPDGTFRNPRICASVRTLSGFWAAESYNARTTERESPMRNTGAARLITLLAILVFLPTIAAGEGHETTSAAAEEIKAAVEAGKLAQLLEDYFEENLQRSPIMATSIGDPRYNDRLPNFLSEERQAEDLRLEQRWLAQIRKIDREALSGQDRLSYDIFVYEREMAIEGARFPFHLLPINQMFSLPSFFAQLGSGGSIQPFRNEKDYRDFLGRIDRLGVLIDQSLQNMRVGIEAGVVQPKPLMEKVLPQLEAHFVEDVAESVFYRPVNEFPEGIDEETQAELRVAYEKAILEQVIPEYKKLHTFMIDEYIPGCRDTTAIADLPDGDAWYAYQVKTMTTTDMTPDEIHQFGLDEVDRIHAEMRGVMKDVSFEGELQDFFDHLEAEERFYYTDEEELLQGYRDLQEKVNEALPDLFDIFPKADYVVKPVPEFMAQSSAGAFYQPGTPDGSRPGQFYVNTFNLKAQAKFGMTTLSIHEASPGHHFQISIAQEIEDLPRFRRFGGQTAFFEGWALYAESLGKEMGLLDDPYDYYGRLSDELLRGMRLVVDTGLHDRGWSREKAIAYMLENSSMAESDVIAEVERYIVFAGQALAYKVGQRVISGLRGEAEDELGDAFDIKAFHRAVLQDGALPMRVLQTKIREWIADKKGVEVERGEAVKG
ncbi:MAG: DUF885 family protein [Thermoanaerobaculia bacterium]